MSKQFTRREFVQGVATVAGGALVGTVGEAKATNSLEEDKRKFAELYPKLSKLDRAKVLLLLGLQFPLDDLEAEMRQFVVESARIVADAYSVGD
jgi:hypothetical protein